MSRRRQERYFNNYDYHYNRRHHGHCGLISLIFDLVFGVITFGLTVAFKVVGAVFQSFFGTLADMDRDRRADAGSGAGGMNRESGGSYTNQEKNTQNTFHSEQQQNDTTRNEATDNDNKHQRYKKPDKNGAAPKKENHGGDWNIIIFVLTLIPAILTLAMGKLLYTGIIIVCGIFLMILYSSIRKAVMSIKKKKEEKLEAEEGDSEVENEVLEKLIKEAFDKVYGVRKDLPKVGNPEIKSSIEALCDKAEKIIGEVRVNPESLGVVKKFFYYYLDTFCEIFRKYLRISSFSDSSEEIDKAVAETEKAFKDIDGIFRELCEKMLEKDMLNLKAEINVMKNSNP